MISINNLTFSYDTNYENIFDNVSFNIDTDWKLGFIGRNGRGKTTFLNLLLGKYKYSGTIIHNVSFDYFPFDIDNNIVVLDAIKNIIAPFSKWESEMEMLLKYNTEEALKQYSDTLQQYTDNDGYIIEELIIKEINKLKINQSILKQTFNTLSNGERTKLMLVALFLKKNNFLLIDEPTNHLDLEGRRLISNYLSSKKGFILVSHDRQFIDDTVDHILSINKKNIEIQQGNFSTWRLNKNRQDQFEIDKNNKLKKDIVKLKKAFERTESWSNQVEKTKLGSGRQKDSKLKQDKKTANRGFIGHKAAKMMSRAKSIEARQLKAIEEKEDLLQNIDYSSDLKINCIEYFKECLIEVKDLSIYYDRILFENLNFSVQTNDRISISGMNGSGKSSIIKLLLGENLSYTGEYKVGSNLIISYVPQDTSFLKGDLKDFAKNENLDESLFKAILRKLDFSRTQFEKDMSQYSSGQKKKVLIAKSLSEKAHLYIWDEPLNFIDIFSRIQIENLILKYKPTMIFVEHDSMFNKNISTKTVVL